MNTNSDALPLLGLGICLFVSLALFIYQVAAYTTLI